MNRIALFVALKKRGMNLRDLSEAAGIPYHTLQTRVYRGKVFPPGDTVSIANVLELSLSEFNDIFYGGMLTIGIAQ